MKRLLLGSPLASTALCWRDRLDIIQATYSKPEFLGFLVNDFLATRLVTRLCQPGKTFIDIGAHIGSIVAETQQRSPSVNIIAIEAIPWKSEDLKKLFPKITVHSCALGENSRPETSFYVNTKLSGYSSLFKPANTEKSEAFVEIKVPVKKLDEIISPEESVDTIKIDVEGAELDVLKGGLKTLKKHRPAIMFESSVTDNAEIKNHEKQDLYALLAENGFAVLVPNRVAHNDPGLSQDGFLESHLYPRRTTNYFAIPNERRQEVRDRARILLKDYLCDAARILAEQE